MNRGTVLSALTLVMGAHTLPASAALIDEAEIGLRYDNNLTKAQLPRDIKDDTALVMSATSSRGEQLSENGRLIGTARVVGAAFHRYHGLDNLAAGLDLTYRWKFGLGALVPEVHASFGATRQMSQDSFRTGWQYASEIGSSQRLTDRAGIRFAYQVEQSRADTFHPRVRSNIPADVFDLNSHNLRFGGDYALASDYVLAAGYTFRKGDIESTTLRNFPIFRISSAISVDPVFGAAQVAYKLRALTQDISVGISRLIGDQTSLTLGYQYLYSRGSGGIDYTSKLVRLTWMHQF